MGMRFYKFPAGRDIISHENGEVVIGLQGIINGHPG